MEKPRVLAPGVIEGINRDQELMGSPRTALATVTAAPGGSVPPVPLQQEDELVGALDRRGLGVLAPGVIEGIDRDQELTGSPRTALAAAPAAPGVSVPPFLRSKGVS